MLLCHLCLQAPPLPGAGQRPVAHERDSPLQLGAGPPLLMRVLKPSAEGAGQLPVAQDAHSRGQAALQLLRPLQVGAPAAEGRAEIPAQTMTDFLAKCLAPLQSSLLLSYLLMAVRAASAPLAAQPEGRVHRSNDITTVASCGFEWASLQAMARRLHGKVFCRQRQ